MKLIKICPRCGTRLTTINNRYCRACRRELREIYREERSEARRMKDESDLSRV